MSNHAVILCSLFIVLYVCLCVCTHAWFMDVTSILPDTRPGRGEGGSQIARLYTVALYQWVSARKT